MIRLYDMNLPEFVDAIVTVETIASSAGDAIVGIDCSVSMAAFPLFVTKEVIVYASPLVIMACLAMFFFARSCLKGGGEVALDQFWASSMIVLNLFYPTLVKRTALMFSCREIWRAILPRRGA